MTRRRRILVSAVIALVAICGLLAATSRFGRRSDVRPLPPVGSSINGVKQEPPVSAFPVIAATGALARAEEHRLAKPATPQPHRAGEKLIEEELAEAGEDPEACLHMNRIREALRYGNTVFARKLLKHMKDLHPDSVLVQESETLFEKGTRVGLR